MLCHDRITLQMEEVINAAQKERLALELYSVVLPINFDMQYIVQ